MSVKVQHHIRLVVWLLCIVVLVCCAQIATAQTPEPPAWRQNLNCDPDQQHYRGVEYCTAEDSGIHVIVVDLHSTGVRLETIMAKGVNATGDFGECMDVNRSTKSIPPPRGPGCDNPNDLKGVKTSSAPCEHHAAWR